jgi:hypothetical protein
MRSTPRELDSPAARADLLREPFDDRLRPSEVPVLGAPGRPERTSRLETGHHVRRLGRREEPRRNVELVLNRESRLEPRKRLLLVGQEQVAARVEPLAECAVVRVRLLRHQTVGTRAPLLPHAARLDPRRTGADCRSLVQRHRAQVALEQVERNGEAADPGSDDADRHRVTTLFGTAQRYGSHMAEAHRILVLGGGLPAYFEASEEEKRDVFLPRFRTLLAEWEELGARVIASFCDDVLQVGPVTAISWAWYLIFEVGELETAAKMIERVRTEVDGVRLDRYVRFEARVGRPFWAREE